MKIPIEIGAMSPTISTQLAGSVLPSSKLAIFDKISHGLTMCYLHGIITESAYKQGGSKLIRKIQLALDAKCQKKKAKPLLETKG